MKKTGLAIITLITAGTLAGCAQQMDRMQGKEYPAKSEPASVYCVQQGGELVMVSENGQRMMYCVLQDGRKLEQSAFYEQRNQSSK